jgi:hypothetical protein
MSDGRVRRVGAGGGAWLRANGSLLRTIDPSDDDDFSDLAPLREIVGAARIVGIGESTHWIHEFYQIRHRLTRFLIEKLGFTAVVMEISPPRVQRRAQWNSRGRASGGSRGGQCFAGGGSGVDDLAAVTASGEQAGAAQHSKVAVDPTWAPAGLLGEGECGCRSVE